MFSFVSRLRIPTVQFTCMLSVVGIVGSVVVVVVVFVCFVFCFVFYSRNDNHLSSTSSDFLICTLRIH